MPRIRKLTVHTTEMVSPHMRRIVLEGDALEDFPTDALGGYVKLLFSKADEPDFYQRDVETVNPRECTLRSMTVCAYDPSTQRLTLDFVHHEHGGGPAARWARSATVGANMFVAGPGTVKLVDPEADWFFIAGDMTSLPAVAVNFARLPKNATGTVVLEVASSADRIEVPSGFEVDWVYNEHPETGSQLADRVVQAPWQSGRVSVWVACEFTSMRAIRRYLKVDRGVGKDDMYISSYWKAGDTDEGHKMAKRALIEAEG